MIPEIEFFRPRSVQETLEYLAAHQAQARLLAGGTDIIPGFHIQSRRFKDIKVLVDISSLQALKSIEPHYHELHIGAGVTFSELARHSAIRQNYPLLAEAASKIGSVQIRNRATLAGNFVNNAPCADSVPPLLVYDARVVIQSLKGQRELPLAEFLLKPYRTQLNADEMVTTIVLPEMAEGYSCSFYKLGRRRGVAISRITLAVLLKVQNEVIEDARVASGAVTPIGKRFPQIEQMLIGQRPEPGLLKATAIELGKQILSVTGLRWSSAYKLPVVQQAMYALLHQLTLSGS